ncbi:asparaginase [Streptomyces sp. NPDC001857]|uniref:asparaginase n=1 Tax=unclassified Streptomyces TaxID=2593676 RepID=UPI00332202B3
MGVALFTLGGTISMAGRTHGGEGVRRLNGADLTAAVPGLARLGTTLDIHDIDAVPSANLTFTHVLDLVDCASHAVKAGARGVVVTQGTDTLEETAFLADLVWPHTEPFVLTGAMRNPTLAGPDGPANLLAAARTAASPASHGLGALVVFNDEIHAARWVRKTHSTSTAAFASPNTGPIGHVIEGHARVLTTPARHRTSYPRPEALDTTRVGLHTVTLDDDADIVAAVAEKSHGLVIAGFGVGHVPSELADLLGTLAERMPVVLTSRTGSGSVLRHTYGSVGSEADLQRRGLINGGLLDPYKARILLRLMLAGGADREAVIAAFADHG